MKRGIERAPERFPPINRGGYRPPLDERPGGALDPGLEVHPGIRHSSLGGIMSPTGVDMKDEARKDAFGNK